MVVRWSAVARERLKHIFDHYLEVASHRVAARMAAKIWDAADSLGSMPLQAPILEDAAGRRFVYRSRVVSRLFRIVYFVDEQADSVVIATVRDCRQSRARLKEDVIRLEKDAGCRSKK